MDDTSYQLHLVAPGGGSLRDVTQLVQSITWSGSLRQTARQLSVRLAVPRDGSVEPPTLAEGAALIFQGEGGPLFTGQLVTATTSTQSSVGDLSALDGGRFLAGNDGWYRFDNVTAEGAARIAASDFGIPTGRLAATGVMLRRKFPGVALDKIITTMYSLAGEQTGKRYLLRFSGSGAMEVIEKAETASLEVAQTMGVTNTWNITNLCNSVAIYTKEGRLVRKVEDGGSQTLNGRLEHAITQQDKEDAGPEAQAWLTDHGLQQNLTVEVLDPPISLITGEAVILRDTGSGVSGLFWVDGDTHSWKNKIHTGKFKLNFRNMMNSSSAGQEL